MTQKSEASVKIACRNVWKVYGNDPNAYFDRPTGPASDNIPELVDKIRQNGAIPAAADVSFEVNEGEIFVIMGLSGSGKSTMVRCLSRLVEPTRGEILLDGEDLLKKNKSELIDIRRHKMGMVFQSFGLLPHLSVAENISFPLSLQGLSAKEQREKTARVIELVGLEG
ncbi:MAG: ATP-binding cassette domain-containing protein, partial [Paracoccaceae bacterium]